MCATSENDGIDEGEKTCANLQKFGGNSTYASDRCEAASDSNREYFMPHGRGPPRHFGQSPYSFGNQTCDLESRLEWKWHHPDGRYGTIVVGKPIVDDEMNIFIATLDGIRKFSIAGNLLWTWNVSNVSRGRHIPNNPAIMNGLVFNCLTSGDSNANKW